MLDWVKDKSLPDQKLKELVNHLFDGGQKIITLVNLITQG